MKAIRIFGLLILIASIGACKKAETGPPPVVSTYEPLFIASTEAIVGCNIVSTGSDDFICGVYMGLSENPETTGVQFQILNAENGLLLGRVSGMLPATNYYIKAFSKNSNGENLGAEVMITTPATISDIDENSYNTVSIDGTLWMAENLATTSYNNGDLIGTTSPADLDITDEDTPKYQWGYDGQEANTDIYGRLYTWNAVTDDRGVCPTGWHIPTDVEWTELEESLGGYLIAGSMLKEEGNAHWAQPYNLDANNQSCFRGLPGGKRDLSGDFTYLESSGFWWSSTESDGSTAWVRTLYVQSSQVDREGFAKSVGASVRCVKDL